VLDALYRTDYIPHDAGGPVLASPTQEGQVPASSDGTLAADLPKHGFPIAFPMTAGSTCLQELKNMSMQRLIVVALS
jgi:hypothetical protein